MNDFSAVRNSRGQTKVIRNVGEPLSSADLGLSDRSEGAGFDLDTVGSYFFFICVRNR